MCRGGGGGGEGERGEEREKRMAQGYAPWRERVAKFSTPHNGSEISKRIKSIGINFSF